MKPIAYLTAAGMLLTKDPKFKHQTPLYAIDFTKFKLVPLEPRGKILSVGATLLNKDCPEFHVYKADKLYKAMIEAAPDIEDL